MMCCPVPTACSSTHLRPSVHYRSIGLAVNIMCIQRFCDHLNVLYIFDQTGLYRFEVRLELYSANALLVVSPLSLSPSHPPTPPPSRCPALTTLLSPSFSSFGAASVKLCCLPPPSLVRNTRFCCLICLKCRRYKGRL